MLFRSKKGCISGTWLLGQQVLGAGIADVLGIANIADIVTDIADIVTDIAGIADRVLQTLRWKQVGVYKVS